MTTEDCFNLGVLTKPHGLQGELVLFIDADKPEVYRHVDGFYVERDGRLVPYFVERMRPHGKRFVVALEGVTDEAAALQLAGLKVYLPIEQLPELDETEFYFHEVEGWTCVDAGSGVEVGVIRTVRDDGPYPMLVVDHPNGPEIILPLPDHVAIRVKRAENELAVEIPDGLLDMYLGTDEEPELEDFD